MNKASDAYCATTFSTVLNFFIEEACRGKVVGGAEFDYINVGIFMLDFGPCASGLYFSRQTQVIGGASCSIIFHLFYGALSYVWEFLLCG